MSVGVNGDELMVRVGPDQYLAALERPFAREMDFTGKALKGFVYVGEKGFEKNSDLAAWVSLVLSFVATLPPR